MGTIAFTESPDPQVKRCAQGHALLAGSSAGGQCQQRRPGAAMAFRKNRRLPPPTRVCGRELLVTPKTGAAGAMAGHVGLTAAAGFQNKKKEQPLPAARGSPTPRAPLQRSVASTRAALFARQRARPQFWPHGWDAFVERARGRVVAWRLTLCKICHKQRSSAMWDTALARRAIGHGRGREVLPQACKTGLHVDSQFGPDSSVGGAPY